MAIFFQSLLFFVIFFSGCKKSGELESIRQTGALNSSGAFSLNADNRPNVVLILADDVGKEVPTCYGGESYETPNIDRMAELGMRFTQCHSSPLCSPSRVTFMTGKYNFRNYNEWGVLDPSAKTLANIMQDAGYATYVAGKWQLDGGDASAHAFGFDNYCLWNAIKDGVRIGSHYKNPHIYTHGDFLSDEETDGKYGDDIFTDSILNFIDENKANNFFVYYPISLCHEPFCPTPDDPEFEGWDSKGNPSDPAFFPSMVKYMDKKIDVIMDKLRDAGVYDNTIVIFVGDNGTPHDIFSMYNGQLVQGGKANTTEDGTNVPMTIMWPNRISGGQVNDNLIDFTDFLPTLADIAGVSVSESYGIIDGHSFYNQLTGDSYIPRDWVFNHYQPNTNKGNDRLQRWAQDHTYKLYDSIDKFYNIVEDPAEKSPLKDKDLTPEETQIKAQLQNVLDSEHN